jgi:hypothetical protein
MTNVEGRKPEGAPERSPKAGEGAASGVDGNVAKRFSVQRKMAVVARMLRGEPLELRVINLDIVQLPGVVIDVRHRRVDDAVDGAHSTASMCQRVVALKRTTMRGAVHWRG